MLKFDTYKTIPIFVFAILVIRVALSVFMIATDTTTDTTEGLIQLSHRFVSTVMWLVVAIWFLHITFYSMKLLSRSNMKVASFCCIVAVLIRFIESMTLTLYHTPSMKWMLCYSLVEAIIVLLIIGRLVSIFIQYKKEGKKTQHKSHHHHHHKK